MKRVLILIATLTFGLVSNGQKIKFRDLSGGKWKYVDLPDSIIWFDKTLHLTPNNPSFWFKDKLHVDVVWNGFYFKNQDYRISEKKNLIFIYIDSVYENVSGFSCILKPVKPGHMKLQYYKAVKTGELPWNNNETWHNTNDIYLFGYKPK